MKKKIFLIGLLACMLITSAACVADSGEGSSSGNSAESASASSDISSGESGPDDENGAEEKTSYTVTFDTDGGGSIAAVEVEKGGKIVAPETPQKSSADYEYEFLGWFYEGEEWDFVNDTVTENITLTAKWKVTDQYTKPFLPKD